MSRIEEYNEMKKKLEDDIAFPATSTEWELLKLEKIKAAMLTDIAKSLALIADEGERR